MVDGDGPDLQYLGEDCQGVPAWEVSLLINPPEPPKPLSLDQSETLLGMAERAFAAEDYWKAHTIAEQAYAGTRQVPTLLYLLDIRVNALEFGEGDAALREAVRAKEGFTLDIDG